MKIFGLQKLTLLDYPGKAAATVFLSGCDFNCPFCHNADLLNESIINVRDFMEFLKSRINLLDGVCVSGGEPLLQPGIEDFLREVKNLGYEIKLDTNGQNVKALKSLVESKLIDYIAMDIKSSLQKYGSAVDIDDFDTVQIEESIDFLLAGKIPYEFRTTVVRELHKTNDFHLIGKRLKGAKKYFLQTFKNSDGVPAKDLSAYTKSEMKEFCNILSSYDINAYVREE